MASSRSCEVSRTTPTVLVVEADRELGAVLSRGLAAFGYRRVLATTGADAIRLAPVPDLLLLDTALPDMDGLDVCRAIRQWSEVPIVLLTDRSGEADRVLGFELGADDYVTKPFGVREVVCRVRAVLRRIGRRPGIPPSLAEPVLFGPVRIDPWRGEVTRNGKRVGLYPAEYDLLWLLVSNPGRAFKLDELCALTAGSLGAGSTNALRTRMCLLREKIEEDPARPRYLRTMRPGGYYFRDPALERP